MALNDRKKVRTRPVESREVSFARQIFIGVFRLVLLTLVFVLVWYVTRLNFFTLRNVTIEGGETISHDEMLVRVNDELEGTYFRLIPKRFSYLYPHDRITQVLEKTPRAHNIVVTRDSRNTLSVTFDEYIPYALWCPSDNEDAPCLFLDNTGFAFAPAPVLHGGSFVRHSIEGVTELKAGGVFPNGDLTGLDAFMHRAETELGLRVTSVVHKKDGDIELAVNGGGIILMSKSKDANTTFENLKSVLTSKEFTHIEPGNFKYVDVRFENKVFVNEEMSTSTAEIATGTEKLPE